MITQLSHLATHCKSAALLLHTKTVNLGITPITVFADEVENTERHKRSSTMNDLLSKHIFHNV